MRPTLIVVTGATGVGKTAAALTLAEALRCPIIGADSRQIYRDLPIGTAAPTAAEQQRAPHHLVGFLPLTATYTAADYEAQALSLLDNLYATHDVAIVVGGSMLYVDALCSGIDSIPAIRDDIRQALLDEWQRDGLLPLVEELRRRDPAHAAVCDLKNPRRVLHALEVCRQSGRPFSSFLTGERRERPFHVLRIGLERDREDLFARISRRVDQMMADGLADEARRALPYRHLNALQTVGYREMFAHFDGECTLEQAVEKIKRNTRVYAKKQMTWFKKAAGTFWFHPSQTDAMLRLAAVVTERRAKGRMGGDPTE